MLISTYNPIPSYITGRWFSLETKTHYRSSTKFYLVTLDVKSLYTSILNFERIKPEKISHENFMKKTIATKVITTFLALNGNHLSTISRKYIHGPFWVKIHIPIKRRKMINIFRHNDDIFLILTGTKNELDQFFKDLNKKNI